ncbi:hypothetical protein P171DRAFT_200329 [Karstenula rhodostoma CBS 690.94]|uniref:Uncharacterized protein n=1 Tax=Karstenula rhodostoma CBS 690.94 TaxID=1392251 RepID=A0A9P4UGQ1_9PLEO|nr:hypothetical protein P171DRAFT_200329 [Karstenula rhodostoma CBS 690.94]
MKTGYKEQRAGGQNNSLTRRPRNPLSRHSSPRARISSCSASLMLMASGVLAGSTKRRECPSSAARPIRSSPRPRIASSCTAQQTLTVRSFWASGTGHAGRLGASECLLQTMDEA